jgi:Flp pilus assembly protein TadB
MITTRTVNTYGYFSIAIMLIFLALIYFQIVDRSLYIPLFVVAALLFAGRITLRIIVMRNERSREKKESDLS